MNCAAVASIHGSRVSCSVPATTHNSTGWWPRAVATRAPPPGRRVERCGTPAIR